MFVLPAEAEVVIVKMYFSNIELHYIFHSTSNHPSCFRSTNNDMIKIIYLILFQNKMAFHKFIVEFDVVTLAMVKWLGCGGL